MSVAKMVTGPNIRYSIFKILNISTPNRYLLPKEGKKVDTYTTKTHAINLIRAIVILRSFAKKTLEQKEHKCDLDEVVVKTACLTTGT